MTPSHNRDLDQHIRANVVAALTEDLRHFTTSCEHDGREKSLPELAGNDLTARLLPSNKIASGSVISRQEAVLCGTLWFEQCFLGLDPGCQIRWLAHEGDTVQRGQKLCELRGNARALLTAERSALNFLQTLSGTATLVRRYMEAISGTNAKIMDTRKTLPGLRIAQKHAVRIGGGHNQRTGLYDGVLIKENHIAAAGGIIAALEHAFNITPAGVSIQIEVENMVQLDEALDAGARLILLDNFTIDEMRDAVKHNAGRAELEASGGITLESVRQVALTGVERISIGALTKDVTAMDLSMRLA